MNSTSECLSLESSVFERAFSESVHSSAKISGVTVQQVGSPQVTGESCGGGPVCGWCFIFGCAGVGVGGGAGHYGGSSGGLKVQAPVHWRGVSILQEKWWRASWASGEEQVHQWEHEEQTLALSSAQCTGVSLVVGLNAALKGLVHNFLVCLGTILTRPYLHLDRFWSLFLLSIKKSVLNMVSV